VAVVIVEAVLTYWLKKPIEAVLHGTENAFHDLELLSGVMARIEAHSFRSSELQTLQRELLPADVSASRAIAKLRSLVDLILSRNNIFVRIIDVPLMYSVQLALATERWRKAHGHRVKRWISIIGQMEALLSLAAYSYEHPDDPFPDLTTEG